MRENNLVVLALLGVIIGASGLAFGIYTAMQVQTGVLKGDDGDDGDDGIAGPPGTIGLVVGIWEHLERNMSYSPHNLVDDWLILAKNNIYNNSKYLNTSRTNTRYHLIKSGTYRISIRLVWTGCLPSLTYYLNLIKNGVFSECLEKNNPTVSEHGINVFTYISSDGDDYFDLNSVCIGIDDFELHSDDRYHQLVIEYIGEY